MTARSTGPAIDADTLFPISSRAGAGEPFSRWVLEWLKSWEERLQSLHIKDGDRATGNPGRPLAEWAIVKRVKTKQYTDKLCIGTPWKGCASK